MTFLLILLLFQHPTVVVIPDQMAEVQRLIARAQQELTIMEAQCARADVQVWQRKERESARMHEIALQDWQLARNQWFTGVAQGDPEVLLRLLGARLEWYHLRLLHAEARHREDALGLASARLASPEDRYRWLEERDALQQRLQTLLSTLHTLEELADRRRQLRGAVELLETPALSEITPNPNPAFHPATDPMRGLSPNSNKSRGASQGAGQPGSRIPKAMPAGKERHSAPRRH